MKIPSTELQESSAVAEAVSLISETRSMRFRTLESKSFIFPAFGAIDVGQHEFPEAVTQRKRVQCPMDLFTQW
jgi:hypothetical protein